MWSGCPSDPRPRRGVPGGRPPGLAEHCAGARHVLRGMDAQVTRCVEWMPRLKLEGCAVCVAGLGVSGPPAARALAARGARVTVLEKCDDDVRRAQAAGLESAGIAVVLGAVPDAPPAGTDLVVTTPGWRPDAPLLVAALAAGVPVIGDVELAWRRRPTPPGGPRQEWLPRTATNPQTTTLPRLPPPSP